MSTIPQPISGLAQFLTTRYEKFRDNRRPIQDKWNKNLLAFRGISTGAWKADEAEGWRSKTFVNLTKQKIITGVALVLDTVLAGGRVPFMLKPSPLDDASLEDQPPEVQAEVERSIADAEKVIDQQLLDCSADRAFMRNVLSAAIYGETYAKRIVTQVKRKGWRQSADEFGQPAGFDRYEAVKAQPGWIYTPCWNIFRDLETDDLDAGVGYFDRTLVTPYWLRKRLKGRFYIPSAIEAVLQENANTNSSSTVGSTTQIPEQEVDSLPPGLRNITNRQNTIRYLEYWGRAPRTQVEEFEEYLRAELGGEANPDYQIPTLAATNAEDEGDEVEIMCCIANNRVVRYIRSTVEERPLKRAIWEDNLDATYGTGVADNAENMQLLINGAVRAYEDNKKITGNATVGLKRRYLDTDFTSITPGKTIDVNEECDDVRKAIMPVVFPDVGESLLSLISMAERFMDLDTMMPRLQQGADVEPQLKAFVAAQQIEKSGKYIGSVVRNFDEGLIEPMVSDFFDYNMDDPEVEQGKGNFIVKALGFTSFQDRVDRITKLQRFMALVIQSPELMAKTNLDFILQETAKSMDLDADKVTVSEEDQAAKQQAAQQDPATMLTLDKLRSEIRKNDAAAAASAAKAKTDADKMAVDRAKAIHEMEKPAAKPEKAEVAA